LWSVQDFEDAVVIVTGNIGVMNRPPIIPFSYITWAAYSEFPDCGETALRNLFNQLVYNSKSQKFDHELLVELKESYYPNMMDALINFYKLHPCPQDSTDQQTAREWIDVSSRLNRGRPDSLAIRYRRERQATNIASPLKNLVRVFNALLGVMDDTPNSLITFAAHVERLRETLRSKLTFLK
jgi:hypothetical protein